MFVRGFGDNSLKHFISGIPEKLDINCGNYVKCQNIIVFSIFSVVECLLSQ